MFYFTNLAIQLNEPEPNVAPTDARNRPDQRMMEDGAWDEANRTKVQLEEKQRAKRKQMEAAAEEALKKGALKRGCLNYPPKILKRVNRRIGATIQLVDWSVQGCGVKYFRSL